MTDCEHGSYNFGKGMSILCTLCGAEVYGQNDAKGIKPSEDISERTLAALRRDNFSGLNFSSRPTE